MVSAVAANDVNGGRATGSTPIGRTLRSMRRFWLFAVGFSIAVNLLMLVSPLYMLQIYDRVMVSGSFETLGALTILATALLAVQAAADGGRRRVLALVGQRLGQELEAGLFRHVLGSGQGAGKLQTAVSDLARVQGLFVNGQVLPLFDAPFAPLFLVLTFLIHPLIGLLTLIGIVLLIAITIATDRLTRTRSLDANRDELAANDYLGGIGRFHSAILAMGMAGRVEARWRAIRERALGETLDVGNLSGLLGAASRSLRQVLQVAVLGVGAWLALHQQISMGAIVASSIIMGRALAPLDQLIGNWRALLRARESMAAINPLLAEIVEAGESVPLPRPESTLVLRGLTVGPPGAQRAVVEAETIELTGGAVALLLGSSGSGKTSLLQTLAGVWSPLAGIAELGARSVHQWPSEDRGRYTGYLPQSVELLPGSIAANIARLGDCALEEVFAAAAGAGAHEMILSLADGYDTDLGGARSQRLSAGQAQLIGIARALFGKPVLLMFDEPTANLDANGVQRFGAAIKQAASEGAIVIVASHDLRMLGSCDIVLNIEQGRLVRHKQADFLNALAKSGQIRIAQGG